MSDALTGYRNATLLCERVSDWTADRIDALAGEAVRHAHIVRAAAIVAAKARAGLEAATNEYRRLVAGGDVLAICGIKDCYADDPSTDVATLTDREIDIAAEDAARERIEGEAV